MGPHTNTPHTCTDRRLGARTPADRVGIVHCAGTLHMYRIRCVNNHTIAIGIPIRDSSNRHKCTNNRKGAKQKPHSHTHSRTTSSSSSRSRRGSRGSVAVACTPSEKSSQHHGNTSNTMHIRVLMHACIRCYTVLCNRPMRCVYDCMPTNKLQKIRLAMLLVSNSTRHTTHSHTNTRAKSAHIELGTLTHATPTYLYMSNVCMYVYIVYSSLEIAPSKGG